MGRDKSALVLRERTLLEHAIGALAGVCDEVVLACGDERRHGEAGLRLVLDGFPGAGPLAGIEAGLAAAPTEWVAVLACDMPRADARVFEALLARARELGADACLLAGADGVEPLCAVYRRRCLAPLREALAAGERKATSFHARPAQDGGRLSIAVLPEAELPAGLARRGVTLNLNTPSELALEARR